jgi:hypothetical protein
VERGGLGGSLYGKWGGVLRITSLKKSLINTGSKKQQQIHQFGHSNWRYNHHEKRPARSALNSSRVYRLILNAARLPQLDASQQGNLATGSCEEIDFVLCGSLVQDLPWRFLREGYELLVSTTSGFL